MPTKIQGFVDGSGRVFLDETLNLPGPRKVIVTILDETPEPDAVQAAASSNTAGLQSDWEYRYEPLSQIGHGGMGFVFKVRYRRTGEIYCLKQLFSGINRASLQQECRALSRLQHPRIIRLIDFDALSERPYFVTEFIEGHTLAERLKTEVTVYDAVRWSINVFHALEYAHRHGVIHRDLKPSNVMIDGRMNDSARVLDFGLAIVDLYDDAYRTTGAGGPAGTPGYMAPEQIDGKELTPACDVYAAGEILYEMVTGRAAFSATGQNVFRIMQRKVEATDGLQVKDGSHLPVEIRDLIHACTLPDPQDRPSSAAALGTLVSVAKRLSSVT